MSKLLNSLQYLAPVSVLQKQHFTENSIWFLSSGLFHRNCTTRKRFHS